MKLKLRSDFTDFYDFAFDLDGVEFPRLTKSGMDRVEMFHFLKHTLGLRTPAFGSAKSHSCDWLVMYLDTKAHCGEGKELWPTWLAKHLRPHCFSAEFLPCNGESKRLLHIGDRTFLLTYWSKDDWRSNCGDTEVNFIKELVSPVPYRAKVPHALFAIDYITFDGNLYAVDFNIAPGMRGSGIEGVLRPQEVVDEIKNWISKRTT